jgi:diacylglycerol kinase (ATP)
MIPAARAALESVGGATLIASASQGDEARCTREALARGATTIVSLGGDGTISQIACELVRAKSDVPLAIFAAGTGNDFAKSLSIPAHNFHAMASRIAARHIASVDAAHVDDTIFVNIAGFGFDTEVLARTKRARVLRGNALYVTTAVGQLFRYRGFLAHVASSKDNGAKLQREPQMHRWLTLVFANGAWFGAGFHIAPHANLRDGLISAVCIANASPIRRGALFARLTRGAHVGQPEVRTAAAEQFVLEFVSPPSFQADGELRQAKGTTVTVGSLPAALRVIA